MGALAALPAAAIAAPGRTRQRAPEAPRYAGHPEAMAFAAAVAAAHGLDEAVLRQQIGQARRIERVRQLIMPPPAGVAKNWAAYRSRFVEAQRVSAGLAFWQRHERWLQLAEERWGVPPDIVVSIVGVETYYGRVMGDFRVIDALATLAFDFPPGRRDRSAFFRSELEELFVLAQREGSDPLAVKGSYAGAMGLPQFMPSSVNRYAVDFDGDGHIDLHTNGADVVGSVAHYLAAFGWQRDMPTHYGVAVPVDSRDRATLLAPDILPSFTAAQFAERGARLDAAGQAHEGLMALVELQNGELAPSYVAGTQNFYVITRYNWSSYYALAVIDLAAALKRARS
jgi:membrane-bound lytic murein transglycosylase B